MSGGGGGRMDVILPILLKRRAQLLQHWKRKFWSGGYKGLTLPNMRTDFDQGITYPHHVLLAKPLNDEIVVYSQSHPVEKS